jgi:uncharacterized protein YjbI with pentapeptide repeats
MAEGRPRPTRVELERRYANGDQDLYNADLAGLDLQGAKLRRANLQGADLRDAKLAGADLQGANLERADLSRADLQRASLKNANLRDAKLPDATLMHALVLGTTLAGADLARADLTRAQLRRADFAGADLQGTKLHEAVCGRTLWAGVNLGSALGLESIKHMGPSSVGLDTILLSGGDLPEAFLRGCGVPEQIIDLQKSLVGSLSPIQFYSCFISYSHEDETFIQRLYGRLQQEKLRVWYAHEEMKAGRKLHEQIDEAIRVHDKLLLVISEASMKSEWVATEISKARKRERGEGRQVLFPIGLAPFEAIRAWECFDADIGKDSAREIREYFIPDFTDWKDHDAFEVAFARLLKDLHKSAK